LDARAARVPNQAEPIGGILSIPQWNVGVVHKWRVVAKGIGAQGHGQVHAGNAQQHHNEQQSDPINLAQYDALVGGAQVECPHMS